MAQPTDATLAGIKEESRQAAETARLGSQNVTSSHGNWSWNAASGGRGGYWYWIKGQDGLGPSAAEPKPTYVPDAPAQPQTGAAAATDATAGSGVAAPPAAGAAGYADPAAAAYPAPAAAPTPMSAAGTALAATAAGAGPVVRAPVARPAAYGVAQAPVAPVSGAGAARTAAAAPGAAAPASGAPYVQVDYSRYDAAAQGYQLAKDTFQNELTKLSGVDPFGNQAFLRQATDRAVAQTAGAAAMQRGGPAALAGARAQSINQQASQQAQGAQQMGVQRAQDQVQAGSLREQAASGLATTIGQEAANEVALGNTAEQAGAANLQAYMSAYGIDAQVTQQDKDSLRNLAVQFASIDSDRYKTDVAYRESVNTNIINKYASDNILNAAKAKMAQDASLTPKDVIEGLLGAGTGFASGVATKISDRRAKFDVRDPDLRDLQDYLGNTKGKLFQYREPNKPGRRAGLNYGPMAQDLARSKIGATVVVEQPDGTLGVDTGRLALADHAALAELARDVAKLKARGGRGRR